jgi:hypothetical protein
VQTRFSAPFQMCPGPTQPLIKWVPGFFSRIQRPGLGVDHTPSSSAEVKERVNYTFIPLLGLRGLSYGELFLYL